MIYTVFHTSRVAYASAELLEHTWRAVEQPGELVRLVSAGPDAPLPRHAHARVFRAVPWSPHPYTGDQYAGYDQPAAILEWLFRERVDGTVLLLSPDCLLRAPVRTELSPGSAVATPWPELPRAGDGPFGLGARFAFLDGFCVDRSLAIDAVAPPLLVHARDLRRIAARWLELTSILRAEAIAAGELDGIRDADRIAYAIAAAEAEVPHEARGLEGVMRRADAADDLALLRPRRRRGVREARLLDRIILEIPGSPEGLALDAAAAALWKLCDDERTLAQIADELRAAAAVTPAEHELTTVAGRLATAGAILLGV